MLTSIRKLLVTSLLFTVITTILLGVVYPLAVTAVAQLLWPDKANGQLIVQNDQVIGSRIIGQSFVSPAYFNDRPSAAGNGYDPTDSSGSNLGPTNSALISRVQQSTAALQAQNPGVPVPVDLVTTSASGLDPDISIAAAYFQAPRIAKQRPSLTLDQVNALIEAHITPRQFGILGEPRVNVLELNLALDQAAPLKK